MKTRFLPLAALGVALALPLAASESGHGTHGEGDRGTLSSPENVLELTPALAAQLLPGYLSLQEALADDHLDRAQEAVEGMMEPTGHSGSVHDLLHEMSKAKTLEIMRRPLFDELSAAMVAAAMEDPAAFPEGLVVMQCPMVYGSTGADWIQEGDTVDNPYFGAKMLRCGGPVMRIGE
jgi:Cu(I)/Ag(I) efflux system membrane fusion protein